MVTEEVGTVRDSLVARAAGPCLDLPTVRVDKELGRPVRELKTAIVTVDRERTADSASRAARTIEGQRARYTISRSRG